jgi:UDPglucose--hexose-1-phosphate uridylyltransferase
MTDIARSVSRATLADGRDIIFFDEGSPYGTGERIREIDDNRPLEPRVAPPKDSASIRIDPLTGSSVALAAHRMNRTFLPPADEDPLAPTRAGGFPSEIPAEGYDVVVFENRFPSLQGPLETYREDALFRETSPAGRCEVVSFTEDATTPMAALPLTRIETIIAAWTHRTQELSALPGVAQVFIFENKGEEIGVTLHHPHGQIYAYSYLPDYTRMLAAQADDYEGDLLGDVLEGELAAQERIVLETEHWVAYVPFAAKWPVEFQVMPRRAAKDFTELTAEEAADLARVVKEMLGRLDQFFERPLPYIAAWHQAPVVGGENISRMFFHVFSLLRSPNKMKFLAGSESAMAAWINDTTPERIAARLREVTA